MDELVVWSSLLKDRTWWAGDSMPPNNRLQFPCLMLHIFASFFDFQYYYYILLFCCTSWIYIKKKKKICASFQFWATFCVDMVCVNVLCKFILHLLCAYGFESTDCLTFFCIVQTVLNCSHNIIMMMVYVIKYTMVFPDCSFVMI